MVKKIVTTVLDIGARYGIHPTWKKFTGEKNFVLLEPDQDEYKRLRIKYKTHNDIRILNNGISDKDEVIKLNIFNNPAMSSVFKRRNISPLFWTMRQKQIKIKKKKIINCLSLDNFIKKYKLNVDFLKIDVEGMEPKILLNSNKIFESLIAVRSEVSFTKIFNDKKNKYGTFLELHKKLLDENFILLNLDYDGSGDFFSKYISQNNKFGVLQNTDAVWIRNFYEINTFSEPLKLLKLISFLLLNNAIDLAIYLLEKNYKKYSNFKKFKKTKLLKFIKKNILIHLYNLKWAPGQNINEHKVFYEKIFREKYLSESAYNENLEINPY
jgi:FkbM family methyltransferase